MSERETRLDKNYIREVPSVYDSTNFALHGQKDSLYIY